MSDSNDKPEELVVTFRNGALSKLKELALRYDVPEDKLYLVIEKGLKLLELPEDNKITFKKGGDAYFVDLKDI